jgi:hypothetical protein
MVWLFRIRSSKAIFRLGEGTEGPFMSPIFDTLQGTLTIEDGVIIRRSLSMLDINALGLVFLRNFNMKNGWTLHSTDLPPFAGRRACFSFSLNQDHLQSIGFAFEDEHDIDAFATQAF